MHGVGFAVGVGVELGVGEVVGEGVGVKTGVAVGVGVSVGVGVCEPQGTVPIKSSKAPWLPFTLTVSITVFVEVSITERLPLLTFCYIGKTTVRRHRHSKRVGAHRECGRVCRPDSLQHP